MPSIQEVENENEKEELQLQPINNRLQKGKSSTGQVVQKKDNQPGLINSNIAFQLLQKKTEVKSEHELQFTKLKDEIQQQEFNNKAEQQLNDSTLDYLKNMKSEFKTQMQIQEKKEQEDEGAAEEIVDDNFFEKNMLSMKFYQKKKENQIQGSKTATCNCQMVRSSSQWSLGLHSTGTEKSIQLAYIDLIQESQYYIYIENQFFISSLAGGSVKNKIAESIYLRIVQAHQQQEKFKILILLPLLPAFEGEINEDNAAVLRIQLHWQYKTICRSENSLFTKLKEKNINPDDYIKFIGLRTHAVMSNIPVTELIYIHSKCMIIDDKSVIIGSANINDRSMNGNRDSEIAMVIEDTAKIQSQMNGQPFDASKFAYEFRSQIWSEIFDMKANEVCDPLSNVFWDKVQVQVKQNTEIYREIFGCYPDNTIQQKSDVDKVKVQNPDLQLYNQKKTLIKGFAVDFPLWFLSEVDLRFSLTDIKNQLAPEYVYT